MSPSSRGLGGIEKSSDDDHGSGSVGVVAGAAFEEYHPRRATHPAHRPTAALRCRSGCLPPDCWFMVETGRRGGCGEGPVTNRDDHRRCESAEGRRGWECFAPQMRGVDSWCAPGRAGEEGNRRWGRRSVLLKGIGPIEARWISPARRRCSTAAPERHVGAEHPGQDTK